MRKIETKQLTGHIVNGGYLLINNVLAFNKLSAKLKVKRFEIRH